MAWQNAQSTIRPAEIDTTSSKKYNYIRRNITEETIEQEGQTVVMYNYEENLVLKEDWETYLNVASQDVRLTDVEDVITEIIGGGDL